MRELVKDMWGDLKRFFMVVGFFTVLLGVSFCFATVIVFVSENMLNPMWEYVFTILGAIPIGRAL